MKKGTISVFSAFVGALACAGTVGKAERDKRKKAEKLSGKFLVMFHMMNQWVKVKQEGKNLSSFFEKNNYRKVAIYGMSYIGETLLEELKGTEIEVAYGIDKRVLSGHADLKIVFPEELPGRVDAIVVTAIDFFDEIEEMLREKVECPIISIEDIVFGV